MGRTESEVYHVAVSLCPRGSHNHFLTAVARKKYQAARGSEGFRELAASPRCLRARRMSCGVRAAWLYCRKYPFATLLLAGGPQQPESIPMEMSWRRQVLNRVIRTVFIIGAACQFAQLPV